MNTGVEYDLSLKDSLFQSRIKKDIASTEKLNSVMGKTQAGFSKLGGALGIGIGVAGIASFGKSILDSLVNYEYFSASLRTLMKGDQEAAKSLQGQLVSLAAKTPFSLVEVQDATKQLLAYGFAAGDVTKNISMLGDVASGLKIPFGDIAYLYGTLKVQGRAFQRDILQFTQRGIPIVAQLAKQFGVSKAEISKMVTAGKIGFPEVEKAFKAMTAEGGEFFNMMSEQSKTVGGQISNLGDNWEQLKVNIGKSQTGIIAGTVSFLNQMVGSVSNSFKVMNKEAENFANYGAISFSWWEKTLNVFNQIVSGGNMSSRVKEQKDFQNSLAASFDSANNLKTAYEQVAKLNYMIMNQKVALNKGEIDAGEYSRKVATIKGQLSTVQGNISLFKQKGETEKPTGLDKEKEKSGTSSTTVEARQPMNFNITIDKLIEKLEFNTQNLKESASAIKSEVTKAMIGAVNDFQLLATK